MTTISPVHGHALSGATPAAPRRFEEAREALRRDAGGAPAAFKHLHAAARDGQRLFAAALRPARLHFAA